MAARRQFPTVTMACATLSAARAGPSLKTNNGSKSPESSIQSSGHTSRRESQPKDSRYSLKNTVLAMADKWPEVTVVLRGKEHCCQLWVECLPVSWQVIPTWCTGSTAVKEWNGNMEQLQWQAGRHVQYLKRECSFAVLFLTEDMVSRCSELSQEPTTTEL